jgi:LuxR family transcriptional regulator, maltose regulon positive regulatory protein
LDDYPRVQLEIHRQAHEPVTSWPSVLLRAKLSRPLPPADYVPRLPLLERLITSHHRRFMLVSAPAGFGKTTLLSAWLAQSESPGAWLSLDEKDNNLVTFLSYFIASIRTIYPQAAPATQALLDAAADQPLPVLASSLINELDELDAPFNLVLDDYHVIQALPVHELLTELVTHCPRPLHLVLASRYDPPLALSQLRAGTQMTEIRAEDLRFSLQETQTLLASVLGANVDADTVKMLYARTEGWGAGLRLAILSLRLPGNGQALLTRLPARERLLTDYLATEVFAKQPSVIQKFLLETSILDRFNAPLSETVTLLGGDETRDGQACLEWLEKYELFIVSLDAPGQWFRLHHLFRDFLQQRLAATYSPQDIATLHRRASRWFAGQNLLEEALQHALAGSDVIRAADLVEEHRHALLEEYRITQLEIWLHLLPPTLIEQRPALLLSQAWVAWHRGKIAELIALVDRAASLVERMPQGLPGTTSLQGEVAALRSFQFYWTSQFTRSFEHAQLALEKAPRQASHVRAIAQLFLAEGYQVQGDLQRAARIVQDGLDEARSNRVGQLNTLFTLAFIQWANADLTQVRDTAAYMLELDRNHNYPELVHWANLFLGSVHYQRNDLSTAEPYLRSVVGQPHLAYLTCLAQSTFALALTFQAQNRPEQAHAVLDTLRSFASETGNLSILPAMQAFRAELALQQGRDTEAAQWAAGVTVAAPIPTPLFYSQSLTLPKVLLAQNTADSRRVSAALLTRLKEFNEGTHHVYALIHVLAVQALLYQAEGDLTAALATLERAILLAEPGGFVRLFVDLGHAMGDLLRRLHRRRVAPAYIEQILAALLPSKPAAALTAQAALIEPLTERELQILALLAQGLTNKEIAARLIVTTGTVKQHNAHLYQKLLVSNRLDALAKAQALGLLPSV